MLAILCVTISLNACMPIKNSVDGIMPAKSTTNTKDDCFVQMADGTIKNYTNLQLINSRVTDAHLLADDSVVITPNQIKAYQDKKSYAVAHKVFKASNPKSITVNTMPGFAVRIAKGKLNIYVAKYNDGIKTTEVYFLQFGDEEEIKTYVPQTMNQMLRDNNEAFNFFNDHNSDNNLYKTLIATANMYNSPRYSYNN